MSHEDLIKAYIEKCREYKDLQVEFSKAIELLSESELEEFIDD